MFEGSGGWRGVGETGDLILEWNSGGSVMDVDRSEEGGIYECDQGEDTDIGYQRKHIRADGRKRKRNSGEEVGCDGEFA
jgi:hypothetical protein